MRRTITADLRFNQGAPRIKNSPSRGSLALFIRRQSNSMGAAPTKVSFGRLGSLGFFGRFTFHIFNTPKSAMQQHNSSA
jgi:hypothetical protein